MLLEGYRETDGGSTLGLEGEHMLEGDSDWEEMKAAGEGHKK